MSELLTVKDLEQYLKVSRQTIYTWRKQGMPYKRVGALVRFDVTEVNEWIKSQNENGGNN